MGPLALHAALAVATLALAANARLQAQNAADLWSLRRPQRAALPAVTDAAWVRQPIDTFVLARLEHEGLRPQPEAARTTLIRRLSFDLTGLPPSPDEVRDFVADPDADAYEHLVDRLLASPHYGERLAQHWLDLARYADTNGYDGDSERQMWAWRDWVIAAFNEDKPFAQFTIEQIAGDLLPQATLAQRIATGFQRHHAVADTTLGEPGEYQHKYAADRTNTFATTWLGLTVGCAECHDHKFDPISQRDYYGLYAFFDRLDEPGVSIGGPDTPTPRLQLPTAEQGSALLELEVLRQQLLTQLRQHEHDAAAALAAWRQQLATAPSVPLEGLVMQFDLDADGERAAVAGIGKVTFEAGVCGSAARLDGNSAFLRAHAEAGFHADQPFTLSAWVRPEADFVDRGRAIVAKIDEARDDRGYGLMLVQGKPNLYLGSGDDGDEIELRARDPLPVGRWTHVLATYDGSRTVEGLQLYVDGMPAARLMESAGKKPSKPLRGDIDQDGDLRIGGLDSSPFVGAIDNVRIHARSLTGAEATQLVLADLAVAAAAAPALALVDDWFFAHGHPATRARHRELADLDDEHRRLLAKIALVAVMKDSRTSPTRLLARGDFTQPRENVDPAIPAVLGSLPAAAPRNRVGLAEWLVHRDNPLVGRVAVNRLWRLCFGHGLVETLDDFGSRGERPSHPELLDWLAREFVDGGGSHKRLLKLLVTSATYRQQSHVDADLLQRDPDNRLLARAGRWRLDAEALRDQALSVGGLLDLRTGGPSVRPWQPADLWRELSPPIDRNRRGLYVTVDRGLPFSTWQLFDAPTREVCTARRDQTTTPLQALVLFNDPNFHAAAEGLARQVLERPAAAHADAARLDDAFRRCTSRQPTVPELHVLQRLLAAHRGACADEFSVWTAVAAVLLNLDETITRN